MKLVKILPDKIQIRTDDSEFKNARMNDLISVSDGEVELVTMITAITDNDVETQMDDNAIMEELQQPSLKVIECSILGNVIDGIFKQTSLSICFNQIMKRRSIWDIMQATLALRHGLTETNSTSVIPASSATLDAESPKRLQKLLRKQRSCPVRTLSHSTSTGNTAIFPMWTV